MSIIGTFTPAKDGGWQGAIRTLTIDVKVRFVPNDNRDSESAPVFRVFAGQSEIGAAWKQRSSGETPKDYLSVKLDDPSFSEAISAAMFEAGEGGQAQLVWSRSRRNS